MIKWKNYAATFVAAALMLGMAGCGVSHKSPESVTESLIEAYVDGKEKKVKDCYGQKKDTEASLQTEIDATIAYFKAHNVKKLEIKECDTLSENKEYTYVYITYDLELENEQKYPCVGTYMVEKKEKDYNILPPSQITDDMRTQAASDYVKFMTTDTYRQYNKDYDTFIKKNPGYEDKIAGKLLTK